MTYTTPSEAVLQQPPTSTTEDVNQHETITAILHSAGIGCTYRERVNAPQLVTYFYNLKNIIDSNKVKRLITPLQIALGAPVKLVTTPYSHIAFEVSKPHPTTVYFREALLREGFANSNSYTALLGRTALNVGAYVDISAAPHVLIAGATGAGKSVLLNTLITSLLFKCTPVSAQFIMIDVKQVELTKYNGIPHLKRPVITDHAGAVHALQWTCNIMDRRYASMRRKGQKNSNEAKLIIVIDELSDLMLQSKKEVEPHIVRIAQLGRAAGIHLIVATQRPTVDVITGMIKANMPCRIALKVASIRDSMNILDHKGAEQLQGKGDALLKLPSQVEEIRFQSAFISNTDIENTVNYWRKFYPWYSKIAPAMKTVLWVFLKILELEFWLISKIFKIK